MVLFDILINDILSIFIDPSILNTAIGIADWSFTYMDIFKLFFVVAIFYYLAFCFASNCGSQTSYELSWYKRW